MKGCKLFVAVASLCVIFLISSSAGFCQDKQVRKKGEDFIPSPIFSPPYPPLPHRFCDLKGISILCKAPKGAIKRAVMPPMEPAGDEETFVLILGWTLDVEKGGYNVHEVAINAPVKYKDKVGNTTLIEYIDSDMGLLAGREPFGWPKKMAEITWTNTYDGWMIIVNKMKDQGGVPLMKIEYKIDDSAPEVKWPDMGPTLLERRIGPGSPTTKGFYQMICLGCDRPETSAGPLEAAPGAPGATRGTATVQFFDGPHDPLTFLGPTKVLAAKMSVMEGMMPVGLGLGEVLDEWRE
jgi:acetoacetate decarboxylase